MGTLLFEIQNYDTPELVINPDELVGQYLFGIPICNTQGKELSYDMIKQKILNAQASLESLLYIKLTEQLIHESSNFNRIEWENWGYVKTSYPVKVPLALEGYYNQIKQIGYPNQWLNSRKEQSSLHGSDESVYFRQIHIIPSGTTGNAELNGVVYNGSTPFTLFLGTRYIPNYWRTTYVTGFDRIPRELIDAVAKITAIQLLAILGDIYLGIGMNSYSISLDGLSQSTSLLKSNEYGVYGSRIKQYSNDLFGDGKLDQGTIGALKAKYRGITFDVC